MNSSRANLGCRNRSRAAMRARKNGVRIRNTDAVRHMKSQLNLVFQKKLARIQAAGVNGFVKSQYDSATNFGDVCHEAEALITATQTGEMK